MRGGCSGRRRAGQAFTDIATGTMVNSGFLNGLVAGRPRKKVVEYIEENKLGERRLTKLPRLGILASARTSPIPMIHCDKCGPCLKISCP